SISRRLIMTGSILLGTDWQPAHLRRKPRYIPNVLKTYLRDSQRHGNPEINREEAQKLANQQRSSEPISHIQKSTLSDETKSQLNELGYL
ncbi:MAG: hypothetical protein ABEI13_01110, partial [Candidatus Paceibacteria bacterium]